jgi:hypothetical protein
MLELLLKTKPTQEPTLKGLANEGEGLKNGEKSDFFSMLLSVKNTKEGKGSTPVDPFKSLSVKDGDLKDVISKELVSKLGSSKERVKFLLVDQKDSQPKEMNLKELFKLAKSKDLNLEKIEIVTDKDIKGKSKEVKTSFDKSSIKALLDGESVEGKKASKEILNQSRKIDPELAQKLAIKDEAEPKVKNSLKTLLASANEDAKKPVAQENLKAKAPASTKAADEKVSEKQEVKTSHKINDIKPEGQKLDEKAEVKTQAGEPKRAEAVVDKKIEPKESPKATKVEKETENIKNEPKDSPKTSKSDQLKAETSIKEPREPQKVESSESKKAEVKEPLKAENRAENIKTETPKEAVDKKSLKDEIIKDSARQEPKQSAQEVKNDLKNDMKKDETQRAETPRATQEKPNTEARKIDEGEPKKSYFEKDIPKEDRYLKAKEEERNTSRVINDEKTKVATPNEPRSTQNQKSDDGIKSSKETSFLEKLFAKSSEFDRDGDSEGRRERKDEGEQAQKSFVKEDSSDKSSGITNRFDFLSRSINAKEALRNLASNLQREAQNYKPPFKKITLELNPAKLGSVEVTMVTRGKNLHINIGSNAQAVALLSQNMIDFKNALNEIGFGEVSMNFNSGDNSQNSPNHGDGESSQKRGNSNSLYTSSNNEDDMSESVEIVLPRYM